MILWIIALSWLIGVEGSIESEETIKETSECYGADNKLTANCSYGGFVAVYGFYFGFKGKELPDCNGTQCCQNETGDCLQPDTSSTAIMDRLSGKEFGDVSTSNAVTEDTCKIKTDELSSSFNVLEYMCIDHLRIHTMEFEGLNETLVKPLYLGSFDYPNSIPKDKGGAYNCSVEALSLSQIEMYTLDIDFPNTTCDKRLDISDGNGRHLKTIDCNETRVSNHIKEEIFDTAYLYISFVNSNSNGGKFWIGFKATAGNTKLNINCPAGPVSFYNGCRNITTDVGTSVQLSDGMSYLSVANFTCREGYNHTGGDATRICQANNTWSGEQFSCELACERLSSPDNGNVIISDNVAQYTCSVGYSLTKTDHTRTCTSGGSWTGDTPECVLTDCGQPEVPSHGKVNVSITTYGAVAVFTCDDFYDLSVIESRKCQADGTWSGQQPVCTLGVECLQNGDCREEHYVCNQDDKTCFYVCDAPPTISDGDVNIEKQPATVGSIASYSCNVGFTLDGEATRTCQQDHGWSGKTPTCIKHCKTPKSPNNGAVTLNGAGLIGTTATFTCNQGYELTGNNILTCQQGATWSHAAPECTAKETTASTTSGSGSTTALAVIIAILIVIIVLLILLILYLKGFCKQKQKHKILIEEGKPVDEKKDDIQSQAMSDLVSKEKAGHVTENNEKATNDGKCPIANAEGVDLDHADKKKDETTVPEKEKSGEPNTETGKNGSESPQLPKSDSPDGEKESPTVSPTVDTNPKENDSSVNTGNAEKPTGAGETDLIDFANEDHDTKEVDRAAKDSPGDKPKDIANAGNAADVKEGQTNSTEESKETPPNEHVNADLANVPEGSPKEEPITQSSEENKNEQT